MTRPILCALACLAILASCAQAAPQPQASGTLVIDGKSHALAHGRAWKNGSVMGVPGVQVMIAESSLADLDWWQQDEQLRAGKGGRVLDLKPGQVPENNAATPPYKYVLEDYQASVRAADFGGGDAQTAEPAPQVVDITVTDGWVTGRVEWKGEDTAGWDPEHKLTAYSATFKLPLEEVGEMPKK